MDIHETWQSCKNFKNSTKKDNIIFVFFFSSQLVIHNDVVFDRKLSNQYLANQKVCWLIIWVIRKGLLSEPMCHMWSCSFKKYEKVRLCTFFKNEC